MNPQKTRFQIFTSRIKNNPIIALLIVFGTIVISLSTFTNAARNLLSLVTEPEIINMSSRWVTDELTNPFNKKDKFRLHFDLERKGDTLLGLVRRVSTKEWYNSANGIIDGKIEDNVISFYTIEQSTLGKDTITYKNVYSGSVLKDEIEFVLHSDRPWGYPPQRFTAKPESI